MAKGKKRTLLYLQIQWVIWRVWERKHSPSEKSPWKKRHKGRAKLSLEQEIKWNVEDIEEFVGDGLWVSEDMARGFGGSLMSRIWSQIREHIESLGLRNPGNETCLEARNYGGDRDVRRVQISPVGPLGGDAWSVLIRAFLRGWSLGHFVLEKLVEGG